MVTMLQAIPQLNDVVAQMIETNATTAEDDPNGSADINAEK